MRNTAIKAIQFVSKSCHLHLNKLDNVTKLGTQLSLLC